MQADLRFFLFTYGINRFSHDVAHLISYPHTLYLTPLAFPFMSGIFNCRTFFDKASMATLFAEIKVHVLIRNTKSKWMLILAYLDEESLAIEV